MSRSGKRSVAFIPSSRRPGFFGIPVLTFGAAADAAAPEPAGPGEGSRVMPGVYSVVVGAGQEVAAATDELALALVHLGAAVRARPNELAGQVGIGGLRQDVD